MDMFERCSSRARALWRAKRKGLNPESLWGFENWSSEEREAHHIAREKYGAATMLVPVSMHRELTRRQMEEHPPEGSDPSNPLERRGRLALGLADILECLADDFREIGERRIAAAAGGACDLDECADIPEAMAGVMSLASGRLLEIALSRMLDLKE